MEAPLDAASWATTTGVGRAVGESVICREEGWRLSQKVETIAKISSNKVLNS